MKKPKVGILGLAYDHFFLMNELDHFSANENVSVTCVLTSRARYFRFLEQE